MPKLIEIDAPQTLQLPRETAATQGADQAAALGQIGKGGEYMGRALQSYQSETAKTAASEYRTRLRSLQSEIEREYDIDERATQFDSRLPGLREKVLGSHKFASQSVFDQEAGIYEDDFRYSINEHVQTEMLERQYAGLQGRASDRSAFIARAEDLEEARDEYNSWRADVDVLLEANQVTAAQARSLKSDVIVGAINNLQDENPKLAGQLLEEYASHISPQQYSSLDNSIAKSSDINASLLAAETVFEENPDASVPQLRAALGEHDLTPEQRKDSMASLRQMVSDRETATARETARAGDELIRNTQEPDWGAMAPVERAAKIAAIRKNRTASPEAVATALRIATATTPTTPVVTDQNVFGRLWRNPQLVGTKGNTWHELADRMTPANWQSLVKRSEALRAGTLNSDLVGSEMKVLLDRYGIKGHGDIGAYVLQVDAWLRADGRVPTKELVVQAFEQVKANDDSVWGGAASSPAGILEQAEESTDTNRLILAYTRKRFEGANDRDLAANYQLAVNKLRAMDEEERNKKLTAMQAELNPPTPVDPAPTSAAPAPEPEQGRQPRIGTFDPLPADFDEPQDVMLLGDNS